MAESQDLIQQLRPGRVVNLATRARWWPPKQWLLAIVYAEIRRVQRHFYPGGRCADTHTMLTLWPGAGFEMTYPEARYWTGAGLDIREVSIYEAVPTFLGYMPDEEFKQDLRAAADYVIRNLPKYDLGDLLDHLLGYKTPLGMVKIFGSSKRFVCSSTVGICWEHARKKLERRLGRDLPRLFFKPDGELKPVEQYIPADFANSRKFKCVWPPSQMEK